MPTKSPLQPNRIQAMIDTPDLPSRLRFMLMDIVDLRRKRWHSKEDNKGPKTLEEIRAEVFMHRGSLPVSLLTSPNRPR